MLFLYGNIVIRNGAHARPSRSSGRELRERPRRARPEPINNIFTKRRNGFILLRIQDVKNSVYNGNRRQLKF